MNIKNMMKNIFNKVFAVLAVMTGIALSSCQKIEGDQVDYLEVNASNLHGDWELTAINGQPLAEGTYFHINFNRSGNEYTIRETLTSIPAAPNVDEGKFEIYTDPELGAYIRGIDSVMEEWSDMYVIKDLTATTMTWIGVNDPDFIQTFKRP